MAAARHGSAILVLAALVFGSSAVPRLFVSAQAPARPQPRVLQPQTRAELRSPLAERPTLTKAFEVSSQFGDRDVFDITLGGPGRIRITAAWRGSASRLAVILNGPGQSGAYARQDGTSPLTVDFDVTTALFDRGSAWRISVVNFGSGQAAGRVAVHYPPARPAIQALSPGLRRVLTAATVSKSTPPAAPERSILPDGRVQVRYPDGRIVIHETGCGTTTVLPDGTVMRAVCNQVQPATLPAVPSDPALRVFLESHRDHLLQQISQLVDHRQAEIDLYLGYESQTANGLFEQIRLRASLIDKLLLP